MPSTLAWHSKNQRHYHSNSKCGPGSKIPAHERLPGTGRMPQCKDCAKLNQEGK
jgi:hypothetical protein